MLNILKENLIDLNELKNILGYSDIRTVKKWCNQNKIPLFQIGAKKYTLSNFLSSVIGNEVTDFANENYAKPDELLSTIKSEAQTESTKVIELATQINTPSVIPTKQNGVKPIIKLKNTSTLALREAEVESIAKLTKHSTATQKFLTNIKVA